MDRFDRQLLEYLLSWAPYGGPPHDAFPEFGLTPAGLLQRADEILETVSALRGLTPDDHRLTHKVRQVLGWRGSHASRARPPSAGARSPGIELEPSADADDLVTTNGGHWQLSRGVRRWIPATQIASAGKEAAD